MPSHVERLADEARATERQVEFLRKESERLWVAISKLSGEQDRADASLLQGRRVQDIKPTDTNVYSWSTANNRFEPGDVPAGAVAFDDASTEPLIDGDAAADGTEDSIARKDHVHPKHHATSHTAASHSDQGATGSELETLTDTSDADALHAHSNHGVTHNAAHTAESHSDQGATGAELETLTDGSDADSLHSHSHLSILDRDLDAADVTESTVEGTLYSHEIPANTLGTTGGVRVSIGGDLLNDVAGTLTLKIKLGGTTVFDSGTMTLTDPNGPRYRWTLIVWFMNSATDAQKWNAMLHAVITTNEWGGQIGDSINALHMEGNAASAEDTTGALTFAFTAKWSVDSASLSMRKQEAFMELLPEA